MSFKHRTVNDGSVSCNLSELITFLRFPMMVAVVLLHCSFELTMKNGVLQDCVCYADYNYFRLFITEITTAAVALFFIFSGYLFFRSGVLTPQSYGKKLHNRLYTLLLPYVAWSVIYIGIYLLAQFLLPQAMDGVMKPVVDFTLRDWGSCLWDVEDIARRNGPIVSQFWYLKELMIASVVAPLLYVGLRYLRGWFFLLLMAMYAIPIPSTTVFGMLFFSLGAYIGIYGIDLPSLAYRYRWAVTLLFVGLITCLVTTSICNMGIVYHLGSLLGAIAYVGWGTYLVGKKHAHVPTLLTASSFFLFAYHQLPVRLVTKIVAPYVPEYGIGYIMAQLLICVFMTALGVAIYYALKLTLPRLTALLCGGR